MKLSILTATYNRSDCLKRLYKSIIDNLYSHLQIEWLIMDDGSVDDTEDIVKCFETSNLLNIRYFKQENQGKMMAINNLMGYVDSELVMDCDSDDYFVNNAFEQIYKKSQILLDDDSLYAIVFLKQENDHKLSGNQFSNENTKTTMFDLYFKDGITGEKIIVFRTDIRKMYRHNLEKGEKFITEARMYHNMDLNYWVKCYNCVLVEGEYLKSGYTNNIDKTFKESPKGYFEYFKEILQMDTTGIILSKRLYVIKHYILFKYISNEKLQLRKICNTINKILVCLLYVPGIIKIKLGGIYGRR